MNKLIIGIVMVLLVLSMGCIETETAETETAIEEQFEKTLCVDGIIYELKESAFKTENIMTHKAEYLNEDETVYMCIYWNEEGEELLKKDLGVDDNWYYPDGTSAIDKYSCVIVHTGTYIDFTQPPTVLG